LFIISFNNQIEFTVPAVFFFGLLLIGGVQKFTDVNHDISFPINIPLKCNEA
jgi:uncharacterized membrane protein